MKMSQMTGSRSLHAFQGGYNVNTSCQVGRKQLLSEPLTHFTRNNPDAGEDEISTLSGLCETYSGQKKQLKQLKQEARKISRQIGDAKANGEPVEALKSRMRDYSARLNSIKEAISNTEQRILDFFGTTTPPAPHCASPLLPQTLPRAYRIAGEIDDKFRVMTLAGEDDEWNNYVSGNPAASIYHRSEWRALIHRSFGHDSQYFYARNASGNIVGVLPLIRLKSCLFGDFMVSMPYFNYGGAIADHPLIEKELMKAANRFADESGIEHVEYRDTIPHDGHPVRSDKVNMVLQLPGSREQLWESFGAKLRAQIKRPQRENPVVLSGREECLDDFYKVFSRNMRDLGTPVYAKSFFRNILNDFPESSRILVVRLAGTPVAAGFLIGNRDTLEIPWASTVRRANHLSVNMLLYWEALRFAIEEKYRYFDFGRSSLDSGTFRFKKQWGAIPRQSYWHYWLSKGENLPSLNPNNPKYALAINIWKKLPVPVTNLLGPYIVRNLP